MALFGKKANKRQPVIYSLLDSNSRVLARGKKYKSAPDSQELHILLTEGEPLRLRNAEIVQAVPQDKNLPSQMVRVVGYRDGLVILTPMRGAGAAMRRNFRVPVVFSSFVYPPGGGRAMLRSVDLSCGGLAFRSPCMLAVGSEFEVVIPITSEGPLLMSAQILRVHLEPDGVNFYACKFIDLIDDEETLLREAVFAIQVNDARAKSR